MFWVITRTKFYNEKKTDLSNLSKHHTGNLDSKELKNCSLAWKIKWYFSHLRAALAVQAKWNGFVIPSPKIDPKRIPQTTEMGVSKFRCSTWSTRIFRPWGLVFSWSKYCSLSKIIQYIPTSDSQLRAEHWIARAEHWIAKISLPAGFPVCMHRT